MRLASFTAAGVDRIGVEDEAGGLVDIVAAARALDIEPLSGMAADMQALIEGGDAALQACRTLRARLDATAAGRALERFDPAGVEWLPPVRRPSKICCLALNNSANSERIMSGPKHPAVFVKPWSALIGNGAPLEVLPEYGRVHPEPELAVVIGKRAKRIGAPDALDHVYGYTIHNDFTSPTMRGEDTFHYRAIHPSAGDAAAIEYRDTYVSYPGRYKCADTFSALGPWLVTADDVADPHDLSVQCHHDGKLVTQDSTTNLFFKIPEVLEFISNYMTLLPGDVISMGTALQRSGSGMAVQNVDLARLGGPVSVTIERLGTLVSTVRRVQA